MDHNFLFISVIKKGYFVNLHEELYKFVWEECYFCDWHVDKVNNTIVSNEKTNDTDR